MLLRVIFKDFYFGILWDTARKSIIRISLDFGLSFLSSFGI